MTAKQIKEISRKALSKEGAKVLKALPWRSFPKRISLGLGHLTAGQAELQKLSRERAASGDHPVRNFALDGKLVGDIGEILAAEIAPVTLLEDNAPKYDARLTGNSNIRIQVKSSFCDDSISIKHGYGRMLALKLDIEDGGRFRVVFDGPASIPWQYVNANKKTGQRITKKEAVEELKPLRLGTWTLLDGLVETKHRIVT